MKIKQTAEGRVTLSDLSPEQFAVVLDAVDELNRKDNPLRPFSAEFAELVRKLREELSKGMALFEVEPRPRPVAPVYRVPRKPRSC